MVQKISVSSVPLGLSITAISTFGTVETNGSLTMQLLIFNLKIIGLALFSWIWFFSGVVFICRFFALALSCSFNSWKSHWISFISIFFSHLYVQGQKGLISKVVFCPVDMQYLQLCSCLPPPSLLSKWRPRD